MKTTHTPAPWTADHAGFGTVYGNRGKTVVCLMKRAHSTEEHHQREADTRLIAAAPDLLKALVDARLFIKSLLDAKPDEATDFLTNNGEEVEEDMRAAIAKAEGRP